MAILYRYRRFQWKRYKGQAVRMSAGSKLSLNPHCKYSLSLFLGRISERNEVEFMQRHIRFGDSVIDIGANIGYFTTLLSKFVGQKGFVMAFEPDPISFKYLKNNVAINRCENIKLNNIALSNKNGNGKLFISSVHTGDDRMYQPTKDRDDEPFARRQIDVNINKLDSFLNIVNPDALSLIKIDVQGFEIKVLDGARNLINHSGNRLAIVTEFWPEGLCQTGDSVSSFWNICEKLGLTIETIDGKMLTISDVHVLAKRLVRNHATLILRKKNSELQWQKT